MGGPGGVSKAYTAYAAQGGDGSSNLETRAKLWGYDTDFLAGLGFDDEKAAELFAGACGGGCPLRIDGGGHIKAGDRVVDLGCGFGHDLVLANRIVGPTGRVVAVDSTIAMLEVCGKNFEKFGVRCCELWHNALDDGAIDGGADVVISNGVFNLTRNKREAFAAAFRILKPGGVLLLSDVCRTAKPS